METCWSIARPLYDGAGFRLPIQQVFVQRLLSGCALLQQETDPIADFPALVTAAQRKGEPLAAIMLADWDAHRRLYVDLDSAPSAAERSSDLARGLFPVASYASLVAAWVAWVHGDDEDLAAHLAAAEAPPASPPWPLHRAPLLQLQALLASVRGHREEATVRADEAVRLATEEGMAIERIRSLEVSSIVARDHRRSVARELLDEALAERGRLSLPRVFLPLVHALD